MPVDVVAASDVVVAAASRLNPDAIRFPVMPPGSGHPPSDVLGTFLFPGDGHFALILSDEIIEQTMLALGDARGLGWDFHERERFVDELLFLADRCGGGVITNPAAGLQLPPTVGASAAAAMRCAASPDLGHPRTVVIVTEDPTAVRIGSWVPKGIRWPGDQPIEVVDTSSFRALVARTRLRLRRR
jgi:hypothetical protein